MTDFTAIKEAFIKAGWALDHVSKDEDGSERSVYFIRHKGGDVFAPVERIRISDHHLGTTIYGQEQGQNLDANFVLDDYYDDTPAEDFVAMAADEDTREVGARGITPSMDEWESELDEVRG